MCPEAIQCGGVRAIVIDHITIHDGVIMAKKERQAGPVIPAQGIEMYRHGWHCSPRPGEGGVAAFNVDKAVADKAGLNHHGMAVVIGLIGADRTVAHHQ